MGPLEETDLLHEVKKQFAFSDEDLFTSLAPQGGEVLYSPKGRLMAGKKAFLSLMEKLRPAICDAYSKVRHDVPELVELAVVIAMAISQVHQIDHAIVAPFSVLAVRHGLEEICGGHENA
jgi:hypothetical protein